MEQPDLNYVKTIIKSVLTSSPINVTISQVLLDYAQLEGSSIPYQQLGFNTVYDLLKDMGDVLKIPHNPNMYSSIKLIVDEKTSHLRELIVNQKVNKKKRSKSYPRKHFSSASSKYNLSKWNVKSKYGNTNNYSSYNNNSCASNPNARGYDYIRIKSADDPKPKGIVTNKLQKNIEHLCSSSQTINISTLKEYLICHPDFGKLQTSNIEDAINMLKYFIYIDKGVIHLKNSPYDIFPSTEWDKRNNIKPVSSVSPYQIFPSVVWDKKNDTKPVPSFEIPPSFVDELDELSITNDLMDEDIYCFMQDLNLNTEYECEPSLNKVQTKNNSDLFTVDKKNENLSKGSTILNDNPLNKNVSKASTILSAKHSLHNESNIKLKSNTYEKSIPKSLKNNGIDYKNMIVSIIMESKTPITVKEVLANFIEIHGYSFPFQKFSCRSCMDYFRLYPAIFNLEDQFSTNSIIRLQEQSIFKRSSTNRDKFIKSTIFKHDNLEKIKLVENTSELSLNVNNYGNQDFDEPIKETCCKKSVHEYEILDSEMILDTMKAKMRCILNKYTNGILCNEFMDIYANEYHSYFTFSEYGFKSMRDMAFNLPSVFYVKTTEDEGECILYNADRRNELQNNFNDPSLYYKNIPKTVLHNLSKFFDQHRNGISFDKLMAVYCSQFGRSYEPLKYGYSSEKHMFESLDKMVKIQNNVLYTLDPFAYTYFVKNNDIDMCEQSAISVDNSLINYCGSMSFVYKTYEVIYNKTVDVIVAEIYDPSSFYIQFSSTTHQLNNLMENLQNFYNKNEYKYQILPELLTVELACASCFEDSMQWHRAKILKIIDVHNVQVLYVDYGSIEIVAKSKIRVLDSKFQILPMHAIHCCMYKYDTYNYIYTREMNDFFASIVDRKVLEATFHKLDSKNDSNKYNVTLCIKEGNTEVNVNNECAFEFKKLLVKCPESIRRLVTKMYHHVEENLNLSKLSQWLDDDDSEEK